MTTSKASARLPLRSVNWLKRRFKLATDILYDELIRRPDELRPPLRMRARIAPGDYQVIGQKYFHYFVDFCGLRPEDRVLDVGCGFGRMAVPLTAYLTTGSYDGFDVHKKAIEWCQRNITTRFPNFHFQVADLSNSWYNPAGRQRANEYRFPYPDETFDLVFLTSVFTHMLAPEMDHYLSEIARVSRKGARSLITYFLLNQESEALVQDGKSPYNFAYPLENCRVNSLKKPEAAVAFNESFVEACYRRNGLQIQQPIRYGSWCGREQFLFNQDIIVAVKP